MHYLIIKLLKTLGRMLMWNWIKRKIITWIADELFDNLIRIINRRVIRTESKVDDAFAATFQNESEQIKQDIIDYINGK